MIVKKESQRVVEGRKRFQSAKDNTRKNPSGGLELKRKTNPNESKYLTIGGRLDRRVHRIHHKKKNPQPTPKSRRKNNQPGNKPNKNDNNNKQINKQITCSTNHDDTDRLRDLERKC